MNSNQIAQLIGLTIQAYTNYQLDAKETAAIMAGLYKLAEDLGVHEETRLAVRQFKVRNYEAPANG